jgi:hypothetical protein
MQHSSKLGLQSRYLKVTLDLGWTALDRMAHQKNYINLPEELFEKAIIRLERQVQNG